DVRDRSDAAREAALSTAITAGQRGWTSGFELCDIRDRDAVARGASTLLKRELECSGSRWDIDEESCRTVRNRTDTYRLLFTIDQFEPRRCHSGTNRNHKSDLRRSIS